MGHTINGVFYSYSSVELTLIRPDGAREIIAEIPEIAYSHTTPRTNVFGTGAHPIGTTQPRYEPQEGSMTWYAQRYRELLRDLGDGYGRILFKVLVKMRIDENSPLHGDVLVGYINGEDSALAQGGDALLTTVPMFWTECLFAQRSIL